MRWEYFLPSRTQGTFDAVSFARNDWVSFETADGEYVRGAVTKVRKKAVRIVDSRGLRYTTSPHDQGRKIQWTSIRPISMGVFILDTQLDKGWRSTRQGASFWKEYCDHAGWTFGYERVHSLHDLRYMLRDRTIKEPILIFNGHGTPHGGWLLSNGQYFRPGADGMEDFDINGKNRHKIVIFSACGMGARTDLVAGYRDILGAEAVIGYRGDVSDAICFLVEPALLQLIALGTQAAKAVKMAKEAFRPWRAANAKGSHSIPITCFPDKHSPSGKA